jgi:hypothetical protein
MNHPLRNPLPVEMRQLLDKVDILQEDWSTLTGRE